MTNLDLNHNRPTIMHIDLNSCFATIEQQANPLLRGKPVVVAAYATPNGCVLSPSIEAKRRGIKVGMTVRDAHLLYPQVVVRTPDPPKYRDVHMKFKKIFMDYSPNVTPKSIDEAVIDFANTPSLSKNLTDVAYEIKMRMRREIGEWITCSIGIATNRFLAKLGAGLHKPDGLDVITHENLVSVYKSIKLTDFCGISTHNESRLNTYGVFTPLDFLKAPEELLHRQVFQSITGYYWYLRLRGWEIDAVDFERKSYGQQYALGKPTNDIRELSCLMMKLCEKMGRRLRRSGCAAQGIHVACVYKDYTHWHRGRKLDTPVFTTSDLYTKSLWVFNQQPEKKVVTKLAVSCFNLAPSRSSQTTLFDIDPDKKRNLSDALDRINDKYGEFVITPALMLGMDDLVLDRIAFGGVKELDDLYAINPQF
ncbi:hypothetical protein HGB07_04100 [Candidatus Roizmanbacteria bacterium]|nr:hypothetical protein [Candidatus Roizmanbacteria bacterium]